MRFKIFVPSVAFCMLILSCCTNLEGIHAGATENPSNSNDAGPKNGRLVFFSATDANSGLSAVPMPPLTESQTVIVFPTNQADVKLTEMDRSNGVLNRCAGLKPEANKPPPQTGEEMLPIFAALGGWVITQVGSWIVDEVNTSLQEEVKKYTTTFTVNSDPFDFYKILFQGKGLKSEAISCFRAARRAPKSAGTPKSDPTTVMDFVGTVSWDPVHPEFITVRPLRLYYNQISSLNGDGRVAVSLKLSADSIWLGRSQGNLSKAVIDTLLVSEIIDAKSVTEKPFYKVFPSERSKSVMIPLPPWNYEQSSITPQHNSMNATLTESQASDVPWLLKHAAALLNKNKDSVTKELVSEAQKAAGVSSSTGIAGTGGSSAGSKPSQ